MKFLIVIPCHNEENFVELCLNSLDTQTFQDFACVIVNDGSTDQTLEIIQKFTENHKNFSAVNLEKSSHEPGAKVVRTFNAGLNSLNITPFEVICKFDADINFPPHYLAEINAVFENNPRAGMVSGLVYIEKNKQWIFENLSSKNHVRGPIKSYRKECFIAMSGLRAVLGWDNIDVMLAQMHGWEVITLKNLHVKHLRPTAYKYKSQKAEKLGAYFYNIGLNFPLAAIASAKSSWKNKSYVEFFTTMKSFLKQKSPRLLTKKEIKYIRRLRWQNLFNNFKN